MRSPSEVVLVMGIRDEVVAEPPNTDDSTWDSVGAGAAASVVEGAGWIGYRFTVPLGEM